MQDSKEEAQIFGELVRRLQASGVASLAKPDEAEAAAFAIVSTADYLTRFLTQFESLKSANVSDDEVDTALIELGQIFHRMIALVHDSEYFSGQTYFKITET